jgi:hypothetical protein
LSRGIYRFQFSISDNKNNKIVKNLVIKWWKVTISTISTIVLWVPKIVGRLWIPDYCLIRLSQQQFCNPSAWVSKLPSKIVVEGVKTFNVEHLDWRWCFGLVDLDFLNIPEHNLHENTLEDSLIDNLKKFLLELGKGFAFVGRQYRLTVNNANYYADLVFYHIILKCYVVKKYFE